MADQFTHPIPTKFLDDPEIAEWARAVTLLLDDLTRPEGAIAQGEATTEVVLTQQEKLDLMIISQEVNLDQVEADTAANTASVATMQSGSPNYVISNDGTVRNLNADAGDMVVSDPPTQAEMQALVNAFNILSDFVATNNRDLQGKGIFS